MFILARFTIVRRLTRNLGNRTSVPERLPTSSITSDGTAAETLEAMRRNGYAFGFRMSPQHVDEIRAFAEAYRGGETVAREIGSERTIIKIDEFRDLAKECPAISELEADPLMRTIAGLYLGAEPVHLGTMLWWSLVKPSHLKEELKFARIFHYDVHDYGSMKFTFYLTDVDQDAGPHVYVEGSHNNKKLMDQMTLFLGRSDQHIKSRYGADNIKEVYGVAGSGFAHDPVCFHKGPPPRRHERLVLQFEFSRRRYVERPHATATPLKL